MIPFIVASLIALSPVYAEAPPVAEKEVEALDKAEKQADAESDSAAASAAVEKPKVEVEPEKSAPLPTVVKGAPDKKDGNAVTRFFRRIFSWGRGAKAPEEVDPIKEGGEPPETEDSQAGTPDVLTPEGDTVTAPAEDYLSDEYRQASRNWEPPAFANQEGALGWSPTAFEVPPGIRKRVDFWAGIYSKYTTDQGVIHDSVHVEVVYESIDFSAISKNESLTLRQKAREREKLIKGRRAEIEERLKRLATLASSEGLSGEDLRIWKLWEGYDDVQKFAAAAKKGRVRFQLGQKDKFILGIYYSGRYIREMERIFKERGLPIELTRLPFVESSFNIFARSKVGASGVWQFMRRTARPYMMVNRDVDERNDPMEATRASARLLKSNYQLLQSWPLAVTGYNHGPYGVRGIVNKLGTRDIAEIINRYSSRTFGFASENFYACFLAALEVERNARRYFGDVKWSTTFEGEEIPITRSVPYKGLLTFFDGDENLARLHNFHLQARVRKGKGAIPRGTFIRVPSARRAEALAFVQGSIGVPRAKAVAIAAGAGSASTVKQPAVPVPTAQAVGIQPAPNSSGTSPQVVSAVADTRSIESAAAARSLLPENVIDDFKPKRYRVRSGDNLYSIAREFGVSVADLKKVNDLRDSTKIRRGQWLTIPE